MNRPCLVAGGLTAALLLAHPAPAWAQGADATPAPALVPSSSAAAAPAAAPPPPPAAIEVPPPKPRTTSTVLEISTMTDLRDRGVITAAEYEAALKDMANSTGSVLAGDSPSLVVGKWSTTIYGFAETDFIHDSTQSFNDLAGNAQVQRSSLTAAQQGFDLNTYMGNHGRTQFSIRNSRLGLRIRAPEISGVRVSGIVETDFLGSVPTPSPSPGVSYTSSPPSTSASTYTTGSASEQTYFTSPSLRIRHAMMRIETPVVDFIIGQYWDLFGWQGIYQPNSVQIQGLPGELYSRDPQLRLSKTLANDSVSFEVAVAALRPPARDSQMPEFQGGLRLALPFWKGVTTNGATATSVMPFSIAVTGDYRHFQVPGITTVAGMPTTPSPNGTIDDISLDTYAAAVDIFIPVIPAKHVGDHALSLTGEAVMGSGIANLYSGLTGGITFPVFYNSADVVPAPVYQQDVDNGLVDFCPIAQGVPANPTSSCKGNVGSLVGVQWDTLLVGLQYYLPGVDGRLWLSGNFSYEYSPNSVDFARPSFTFSPMANYYGSTVYQVRKAEYFVDGNVFFQITPAARIGAEFAVFNDEYVDGVHAVNDRAQLSGFFIF
jgi:hypothetical protein